MNCTTAKCMIEEWYNEHLACETEQKTNSLKTKLKKRVINSFTSRETTVYWGKLSEHQIKSVKQQGRKKKKKKSIAVCFPASQCPVKMSAQFSFPNTHHQTYHFMRNIRSPHESVAPIIFSGSSPRSKPRATRTSSLKTNLKKHQYN